MPWYEPFRLIEAVMQAKEEQIPLADALMLNAPEDWASAIKNTL